MQYITFACLQLANHKIYLEGFLPAQITILGRTFAKHLSLQIIILPFTVSCFDLPGPRYAVTKSHNGNIFVHFGILAILARVMSGLSSKKSATLRRFLVKCAPVGIFFWHFSLLVSREIIWTPCNYRKKLKLWSLDLEFDAYNNQQQHSASPFMIKAV